jgi:hypothetical protein
MKITITRKGILTSLIILAALFALIQFSPFGMAVYAAYAAFVIGLTVVFPWRTFLKEKAWKWWVITPIAIPLLAAPVAEEIWIAYHFKEACKDAGVHIKRKAEVDGYLNATSSSVSSSSITEGPLRKEVSDFEKQGFKYKESLLADGKIMHLERKNNWLYVSILDQPVARYHVRRTHSHDVIGYQIKKYEREVFDTVEKEVIGRDTKYARYPSTVEKLWIHYLGTGQLFCKGPSDELKKHKRKGQIDKYVLLPNINTQE